MKVIFAILLIFIWNGLAFGQNRHGEFDSEAAGAIVQHPVRPYFRLDRSFNYRAPNNVTWTAPAGEVVDGASIPAPAWSLVGGPFDGGYLWAAIIHDYYCCAKSREWAEIHDAFWLGMLTMDIPRSKASLMWAAVWYMGPDKWTVIPDVDPSIPCNSIEDHQRLALDSQYDRINDQGRRIAVAKFTGMIRKMYATGGRVVDVVDGRLIHPNMSEAKQHLDNLHRAMRQNFDFPRDQLGLISVLTDDDGVDLDEVAPWHVGQIKALDYMSKNDLTYPLPRQTADGRTVEPVIVENPFATDLSAIPEPCSSG